MTGTQAARKAKRDRLYAVARVLVFVRSQGACEGCGAAITPSSMHAHHRLMRSQGRDDRPVNLLALCGCCHTWCHHNVARSYEVGWLLHFGQDPAEVQVLPCTDRLMRR